MSNLESWSSFASGDMPWRVKCHLVDNCHKLHYLSSWKPSPSVYMKSPTSIPKRCVMVQEAPATAPLDIRMMVHILQ
jgi:hypothetical protein